MAVQVVGALAMMDAVGGRALLGLCWHQGLHTGSEATGTPKRRLSCQLKFL